MLEDRKLRESKEKTITTPNNKTIQVISDCKNFDFRNTVMYDALIIDYSDSSSCENLISEIKKSNLEAIFLTPIFILSLDDITDQRIVMNIDGIINSFQEESIENLITKLEKKQKTLKYSDYHLEPLEKNIIKLLRYIYTRGIKLKPIPDYRSPIGYFYPFLSLQYDHANAREMIKLIQTALEKGFITEKFNERVHICPDCNCSHLNIQEKCPKCLSSNLETENLVHHFSCAYIGPESDFASGDDFICPKCNKKLRHIGVDYDKPSMIYICNNCSYQFQEPQMTSSCFSCNWQGPIENLIHFDANTYTLSESGEEIAINGYLSGEKIKESNYPGFLSYSTFITFLNYEIERIKRSKQIASIGSLTLTISKKDKEKLGIRYPSLLKEMAEFVRNTSLSSDILSVTKNNTFLIISTDVDKDQLKEQLNSQKESFNHLLSSSLSDSNAGITISANNIEGKYSAEETVKQLLIASK